MATHIADRVGVIAVAGAISFFAFAGTTAVAATHPHVKNNDVRRSQLHQIGFWSLLAAGGLIIVGLGAAATGPPSPSPGLIRSLFR
jgi:hypothetical protein